MKISFVGDIMLGRFVRERYENGQSPLVSRDVRERINNSDLTIANLESPITNQKSDNSLAFAGSAKLLNEFEWINLFSLSNNHINDFGEIGISDTILFLNNTNIQHNGIYIDHYRPFLFEKDNCKIAIVTCTDMINHELSTNSRYKTLRADSIELNKIIQEYTSTGYFVFLFAHCGSLFCRFPNPGIREILHSAIDAGAKCVVTCHSHCLGGKDAYNNVPIFYSLGDFLMDGGSYRRRKSCVLTLKIENNQLLDYEISPVITTNDYQVMFPNHKVGDRMLKDFNRVSEKMQKPRSNYKKFFKWQYKKEILFHSLSTLRFLYDTKGFCGFLRLLKVRSRDVLGMTKRMLSDRSNMRCDMDAVNSNLNH